MRAPTNYAGPRANDGKRKKTHSQKVETTRTKPAVDFGTVKQLLATKGNDLFTVQPSDSMRKAVDLLKEKRIGALIVTSGDGALRGILSERDIVRRLSETPGRVLEQKVEALMTHTVQTVSPDEPLAEVLHRMTQGRFRHMPVLHEDKLCGMVTIGDVVNFRLKELEYETIQLKQLIVG
ncbi:MAG: CBS domain-containing protein [Pseudomonadota bacterium]